jgi:uncharacterized membrane protein YqiK
MQMEVHRMEQRLRQLTRKQDQMIEEMERAIEKRESIDTR